MCVTDVRAGCCATKGVVGPLNGGRTIGDRSLELVKEKDHGSQHDREERQADGATAMIGNILSPTHLLLVLAVVLIVLGPKRLPEVGRGLGSAIRGFKEALSTDQRPEDQPAIETSSGPDETPDGSGT